MTEEAVKQQAKELRDQLKNEFGRSAEVRTRSGNKLARTSTKGMWDRSNKTDILHVGKNIGDIAIAILDFYPDEKIKKNDTIMIKIVERVNNLPWEISVKPMENSIYREY